MISVNPVILSNLSSCLRVLVAINPFNKVLTKDYDIMDTWSIRKTKPIQSQLKPIKANSKPIKANKMTKQTQSKPIYRCVASGEDGNKPKTADSFFSLSSS
jgi:hypothetical protein